MDGKSLDEKGKRGLEREGVENSVGEEGPRRKDVKVKRFFGRKGGGLKRVRVVGRVVGRGGKEGCERVGKSGEGVHNFWV